MENSGVCSIKKMITLSRILPLTDEFQISKRKRKILIFTAVVEYLLGMTLVPLEISLHYQHLLSMDKYFVYSSPIVWLTLAYPAIINYFVRSDLLIDIFNVIFDRIDRLNNSINIRNKLFKLYHLVTMKFIIFVIYVLVSLSLFDSSTTWRGYVLFVVYTRILTQYYLCIDIYSTMNRAYAILLLMCDRIVRCYEEVLDFNYINSFSKDIFDIVSKYTDIVDIFKFSTAYLTAACTFMLFSNSNLSLVKLYGVFSVEKCSAISLCYRLWLGRALPAIFWMVLSLALLWLIFDGPIDAAKKVRFFFIRYNA